MKICIRDDDLSYWSNFDDFRKLYDELDVPVSISLIPNAVANHGGFMPYGDNYPKNEPHLVTENKYLCKELKKGIDHNKYELLLHGYTHEYKEVDGGVVPELLWKSKERLLDELTIGKSLIEKEFEVNLSVLVAPSQGINQDGIDVMNKLGMNFSGLAHGKGDRKKNFRLLVNMIRRYASRLLYGFAIMGVAKFKHHKEQGIIPIMSLDRMIKYYKICRRHNWNYVIVTHYWQLLKDNELKSTLKSFIEYVKRDSKSFSFVSECYR